MGARHTGSVAVSYTHLDVYKRQLNTYRFVEKYIDPAAPGGKEHIGYIIDRVGFQEYKKWALDGVELLPETIVKDNIYWSGIHYR